jgi:hypothetical protein
MTCRSPISAVIPIKGTTTGVSSAVISMCRES